MSDPRFSIIPAGAVLDPRLEARDLQVLCVFGKHTDKKGWCRRSQVVMAREMSCARSTVQGSIDRLVAAGWLDRRPANDHHTPGVRDSAHEYRVVLDTRDEAPDVVSSPADLSAPLPTISGNRNEEGPDSGHRHPPAPGAALGKQGVSGGQKPVSSAPMLTTSLNEQESPQPPKGGEDFNLVWEKYPLEHRGSRENAEGAFNHLDADERASVLRGIDGAVLAYRLRKTRTPALKIFISARHFVEFDGAPEVDFDGYFKIKPGMPEWSAHLGEVRKEHGPVGVERVLKTGFMLRMSRWPQGHPSHNAALVRA